MSKKHQHKNGGEETAQALDEQDLPEVREPEMEVKPADEPAPEKKPDYYDQLVRLSADFDNYRKRTEREKASFLAYGKIEFDEKIHSIKYLQPGITLNGIVTNITQFGIFVDIGVHVSGLVHISEMSDQYISHPSQVANINDHVTVRVLDVDSSRNRISLTMKGI